MSNVACSSVRDQAFTHRKNGKSYSEISRLLGVAKSTLSNWLKDVPFSEEVKKSNIFRSKQISAKNISEFNALRHKLYLEKTQLDLLKFASEVPVMKDRDLFFLFLGLFWGEGSKRNQFRVEIANSDPDIIKVCMRFLRHYCGIPLDAFLPDVQIYSVARKSEALTYWSNVSGIPASQIKVYVVKERLRVAEKPIKDRLPFGTFYLRVNRVKYARHIQGWLRGIKDQATMPE